MAIRRARAGLLTEAQRVRLEAEFDRERTEMFFATAVVLVEGQTERLSLPLMFRRLGHDPDALGISIVEVGGKGNLVLVARVLAARGFGARARIHDHDDKVLNAWRRFSTIEPRRIPAVFRRIVDTTVAL